MPGMAQALTANKNARVGIVDVYVAPELTTENAASGWQYVGVMDPGSFQPNFNKDKFVLETGFPRTVKIEAVTRVNGALSFTLTEYNTVGLDLACGSGAPSVTYATTPTATTVAASPTPTTTSFGLTSNTNYAVGQLLEITLSTGKEYAYLIGLNGSTATVAPALSAAPVSTNAVKAVKDMQFALGTSVIPRKAFKAVFTDQNGDQAVIYCPSVGVSGGYSPNFADAQNNAKIPITLQAYGVAATWNGVSESIVGYTFLRPGGVS